MSTPFKDFDFGRIHLPNISQQPNRLHKAISTGKIQLGEHAYHKLEAGTLCSGDPIALAETAGLYGAKNAHLTLPSSYHLHIEHIRFHCEMNPDEYSLQFYCLVQAYCKTGLELSALNGVQAALLTLYDLAKDDNPNMSLEGCKIIMKEGDKNGPWCDPNGLPDFLADLSPSINQTPLKDKVAAIVTVSDKTARGEYPDESGRILHCAIKDMGAKVIDYTVIPDCANSLKEKILKLIESIQPEVILTTGGTGLEARDITPQVLNEICERTIPGVSEKLRLESALINDNAWLSRTFAGTINNTLVIALPGNPELVAESALILKALFGSLLSHHDIQSEKSVDTAEI